MIHSALLKLTWMLTCAGIRQAFTLLKSPLGLAFAIGFLLAIGGGLLPSIMATLRPEQMAPTGFAEHGESVLPLLIFFAMALIILTEGGKSMLELRPPELQFVLAGPFTSAQILTYRLITVGVGLLPLCLFGALMMRPHLRSIIGGMVGFSLTAAVVVLLGFQYTLIQPRLSSRAIQAIRLILLCAVGAVCAEGLYHLSSADGSYSFEAMGRSLGESKTGRVVGAPFMSFAKAMLSDVDQSLLFNGLVSFVIVVLIGASCYLTGSGFAELAVEGVARRQKKLDRVRSGNAFGSIRTGKQQKRVLPPLPYFSGIGPIVWLEITSVIRRTGRLLPGMIGLGLLAALIAGFLVRSDPELFSDSFRTYAILAASGAATYAGCLFAVTASLGLAAPSRTLTWYKTLPLAPIQIAFGATAGLVTLLSGLHFAFLLPAIAITTLSVVDCVAISLASLAFSLSFASAINLVSSVTGLRPMPQGTPDIFQGARAMLYMLLVGITLIPSVLFGVGMGAMAALILGPSWMSMALGSAVGFLLLQPMIWWFTGRYFQISEA